MISIIIFVIILQLGFSEKTSPRKDFQEYMYANGCKHRLLNKIIASTIYKRNIYINYNFLNTMILQHTSLFSKQEILHCYEVIGNKIIQENQQNNIQKYYNNYKKIDYFM
jgi:hypothetical protein